MKCFMSLMLVLVLTMIGCRNSPDLPVIQICPQLDHEAVTTEELKELGEQLQDTTPPWQRKNGDQ